MRPHNCPRENQRLSTSVIHRNWRRWYPMTVMVFLDSVVWESGSSSCEAWGCIFSHERMLEVSIALATSTEVVVGANPFREMESARIEPKHRFLNSWELIYILCYMFMNKTARATTKQLLSAINARIEPQRLASNRWPWWLIDTILVLVGNVVSFDIQSLYYIKR